MNCVDGVGRRRLLRRAGAAVAAGLGGVGALRAAEPTPLREVLTTPLREVLTTPLRVVASFSILADMAREVAGPTAEVTSLVPANVDAHAFQPTPADVQRLARAELVLVNGLGFEGWIERLVVASGQRRPPLVASRGIVPRSVAGGVDPHAWQSLAHARVYVDNIRAAIVALRPGQAALLEARAADYRRRIDALDARARTGFDRVPPAQRRVITSHQAFGYLGDAYGVRFFAPQGWSTDTEASAADMARAITQARTQGVRALFVENASDRRLVDGVAREARLAVGGTLYADALSAPGGPADTYLKLYAHNVDALLAALLGGVDARSGSSAPR